MYVLLGFRIWTFVAAFDWFQFISWIFQHNISLYLYFLCCKVWFSVSKIFSQVSCEKEQVFSAHLRRAGGVAVTSPLGQPCHGSGLRVHSAAPKRTVETLQGEDIKERFRLLGLLLRGTSQRISGRQTKSSQFTWKLKTNTNTQMNICMNVSVFFFCFFSIVYISASVYL